MKLSFYANAAYILSDTDQHFSVSVEGVDIHDLLSEIPKNDILAYLAKEDLGAMVDFTTKALGDRDE